LRIVSTGSALPAKCITNADLSEFLDTSDEWISTRTGIRTRRILTDETLDLLASRSARQALDMAGLSAGDIDLILCSTVQGEWVTPALACAVQRDLGAVCPAFDLNGACAGFVYALDVADAYLRAGKAGRILVVCAEAMSRLVDWTRRETCVLFGDGAAAVVVDGADGLMAMRLTTRGDQTLLRMSASTGNSPFADTKIERDFLYMAGQEVYRFAVSACVEDLRALLAETGLEADQIDHYLLHQANLRILEAVRARMAQPAERFAHNMERCGNTSSASLPILLDELNRGGALRQGQRIALSAFGAGLVTGSCIIKWNPI
jgi:3-oxoacyl-[acyl-carrier-protein] synthase-3